MIVTIRYGEDKKVVMNANCRNYILLEHIRDKCDCHQEDIIDLADDSGNIKFLHRNLMEYGTDYLSNREVLVLLKVDHDEERAVYIPMLKELEENTEFITKLNPIEAQRSVRARKGSNKNDEEQSGRRSGQRRGSRGNVLARRKSLTQSPRKMSSSSGAKPSK